MISFFCGDAQTGVYSVAIKIKTILVTLLTSAISVYLPRLSICIADKDIEKFCMMITRSLKFVFFIALPLFVFFFFTSDVCIRIMAGNSYDDAIVPMQILMPTILIIGITYLLGGQALVALGRNTQYFIAAFSASIIDVILNLKLIPLWGIKGAALSTVIAEIFVLLFDVISLHDILLGIIKKLKILKVAFASVLGTFALEMFRKIIHACGVNSIIYFGFCAIIYFAIYALTLLITKEELFMECVHTITKRRKKKKG
jgi:O-antigen/teichoic acid export membrane protein